MRSKNTASSLMPEKRNVSSKVKENNTGNSGALLFSKIENATATEAQKDEESGMKADTEAGKSGQNSKTSTKLGACDPKALHLQPEKPPSILDLFPTCLGNSRYTHTHTYDILFTAFVCTSFVCP